MRSRRCEESLLTEDVKIRPQLSLDVQERKWSRKSIRYIDLRWLASDREEAGAGEGDESAGLCLGMPRPRGGTSVPAGVATRKSKSLVNIVHIRWKVTDSQNRGDAHEGHHKLSCLSLADLVLKALRCETQSASTAGRMSARCHLRVWHVSRRAQECSQF